ncbi:M56 family metallopeptidase [Roseivirga sp.]|uniref:M56 family metallopeptidase n=1 Tax=Roseivirga sp. TaxID=1964215 RepID=UPI003B52CC44
MEINNNYLDTIGLSLVHSLWQGALLLFIVFLLLVMLRHKSARLRHAVTLTGLMSLPIMLLANLIFFWPETAVDNSAVAALHPEQLSPVFMLSGEGTTANPQSHVVVMWLTKNASIIALIWTIGVALFVLRTLGSVIWMRRLVSQSVSIKGKSVNGLLERVKSIIGIQRHVQIRLSSWISSPVILGVVRPTILFPIGLIEGLSTEEVEAILYHELAHLKRNDFVINIIINVLQIVFFYHPSFWWLKSQLDNEREFATDELALHYSDKKLPMIKALAKVQAFSLNSPAVGFAGNSKNQVLKRINVMMNSKQQPHWLSATFTMAILLVAFALMSAKPQQMEPLKQEPTVQNINEEEAADLQIIEPQEKTLKEEPNKEESEGTQRLVQPQTEPDQTLIQSDTIKVSDAILELISNKDAYEIELDNEGKLTQISKDGKEISGRDFETFKEAYAQIQQFRKEEVVKIEEMRRHEEALAAQVRQVETANRVVKSYFDSDKFQRLNQLETEYSQLQRKVETLAKEKAQLEQHDLQLIEEHQTRMDALAKELLELHKVRLYNDQIDRTLHIRNVKEQLNELGEQEDLQMKVKMIDELKGKPLIELNGELREDLKLSDINMMNVESISVINAEQMEQLYPKRKVKGYAGIIRITTKK